MANQRRLADNVNRYEAGRSARRAKARLCCRESRSAAVAGIG